jgi:hypothetical protein
MLTDHIKVGDIVFTLGPIPQSSFTHWEVRYQWMRSALLGNHDQMNYRKVHAFICTETRADGAIMIAQIGGFSKTYDYKNLIGNIERVNHGKYEILRPNDQAFIDRLVALSTDKENKNIIWTYGSLTYSLAPIQSSSAKTLAGFSLYSNCALFISEAVKLAKPEYVPSKPNMSIAKLWETLKSTGAFDVISRQQIEDDKQSICLLAKNSR